jgi:hypothetical protein
MSALLSTNWHIPTHMVLISGPRGFFIAPSSFMVVTCELLDIRISLLFAKRVPANEQSSSVAIALVMHFNAKALTVTGCPNTVVFLRGLY